MIIVFNKKKHKIKPLTWGDLEKIEEVIGKPLAQIGTDISMKMITEILFLGLKHVIDDITKQDIKDLRVDDPLFKNQQFITYLIQGEETEAPLE